MHFVWEMIRQGLVLIGDGDSGVLATGWRTIWLALVSTAIALAFGLPVALVLAERESRLRRAGLVLANAGLGLPPVVLGVYVALALEPGSVSGSLRWSNTLQAVVLAQAVLALPIVVALTATAVRGLPQGLLDQARAFGASRTAVAGLALREARVGVIAALITAFGSAIAEVGAVVIVGGNIRGQTNTLASTILLDLSAANPAAATADVLVLLGLVAVLGGILTIAQQRGTAPRRRAELTGLARVVR